MLTECLPYARYHLHILANQLEGQNLSRIMSVLERSTLWIRDIEKLSQEHRDGK